MSALEKNGDGCVLSAIQKTSGEYLKSVRRVDERMLGMRITAEHTI